MIARRAFLRSLLAVPVLAHTLDIEKLLWVPGAKKVFLPPPVRMPPLFWRFHWDADGKVSPVTYTRQIAGSTVHEVLHVSAPPVLVERAGRRLWLFPTDDAPDWIKRELQEQEERG